MGVRREESGGSDRSALVQALDVEPGAGDEPHADVGAHLRAPAKHGGAPEPPPLRSAQLMQLQRLAGNRAVASLMRPSRPRPSVVQRQTADPPIAQRDLTEDQKKSWEDHGGPRIIAALKATIDEWKRFRESPDSYENLPKPGKAPVELAELLRDKDPEYARYAAAQLGGASIKYLGEMAGMLPDARNLTGVLPGLVWVDPQHKYELKTEKTEVHGLINFIPMIPVGTYTVTYTNAFNWKWTKTLVGSQAQWKVGIGWELGEKEIEEGVKKPSLPAKGSGFGETGADKKGSGKIGRGMIPMPATISVNSSCKAQSVPYWGYKDLAGLVMTGNGPSVKLTVQGTGLKEAITGGIITFYGSGAPGTLNFENLETDIVIKPTGPTRPSDVKGGDWHKKREQRTGKNWEISLTLLDAGVGFMVGGGQTVAIPEPEPRAVQDHKEWHYVVTGFETGDPKLPIPPGEMHPILAMMKADMADKKKEVEEIKPMLEELGVEQDFKLTFVCEGYASRKWAGAMTDAERQTKNQELSMQRADNVVAALKEAFGEDHLYSAVGKGAGVWLPGGQFGEVVQEADKAEIERRMKLKEERIRKENKSLGFTDDQVEKMITEFREGVAKQNARTSDISLARRVNISVLWDGFKIEYGMGEAPALTPRE